MPKKKIFTRLDKFFETLPLQGEDSPTAIPIEETSREGWLWVCDAEGRYTQCGIKLANALKLAPEDFIGQAVSQFHLDPQSTTQVQTVLNGEVFPTSINVTFHSQSERFWGQMFIDRTEDHQGWTGLVEILSSRHSPTTPLPPRATTLPQGVKFEDALLKPAQAPLTSVGIQAMKKGTLLKSDTADNQPAVLAVPLQEPASGTIGLLEMVDPQPDREWDEDEQALASEVADQLVLALENASLFQQTQTALSETETLYRASAELNQAQSYEEILNILCRHTLLGDGAHHTAISMFNRPWEEDEDIPEWSIPIALQTQFPSEKLPERYSLKQFPAIKLLRSEPFYSPDLASETRLDKNTLALFTQQMRARSVIFITLNVGGQRLGFINAYFPMPRAFTEQEIRRLDVLASQAAVAVQNLRLFQESRRRAQQLQTAAEIARDTSSASSALDVLLRRAVNLIRERFEYYHASIFLLDEAGSFAEVRESTGEAGSEMKKMAHKLAVGSQSVIGQVTANGEPLVVNDVSQNPYHRPNPLLPETRAELGIPLKIGLRVIGALDVQSIHTNAFSEDDIGVLQILTDQLAVAVENARAYQLVQQAVQDMQEADRLKSQFLANMSHELRTPLNSIIGFSRVIIKGIDGPITDLQEQDLTAIYNSGQHLLALINDILDLSKIEAGKMELSIEDVQINDLINSVLSTAKGLVKDKDVELHKEIDEDIPEVKADPIRVRQVLLNLLSNASKFTDQGSITVKAYVRNGPGGRPEIYIGVTDTGTGIAPEDQYKLFQPFSQVDDSPTRKTGGTGLGLSICRRLIELHHGIIDVESEVGKGSTFYFTLPLPVQIEQEDMPIGTRVILSIEDNPDIINLYARYLNPQGYQVVPVEDVHQAVSRAKELKPYAITLDVLMPEKDGWTILQELKSDPETKDIPVVMCTILDEQEKGFSMGAADYLLKPILEEDLVRALRRLNMDGSIHNILVVDDDPNDLRLVQKILVEEGHYQIVTAPSGEQGLKILSEQMPDALILDLFMPDMDGFSVLEEIRSKPEYADLAIIVLSGMDLDAEHQNRLAEFGQHMLQKAQFSQEELLTTLESALARYQPNKKHS